MKKPLFFILFFQSCFVFAQSKKEQIKLLTARVDSLIEVIKIEEQTSSSTISNLKQENLYVIRNNENLELELEKIKNELKNSNELNHQLVLENTLKSDSLKQLSSENIKKNNSFEYNDKNTLIINASMLRKLSTNSMRDIYDWLKQFKELSFHSIRYFDKDLAKDYGGYSYDPNTIVDSSYGRIELSTRIYKEGIVFMERSEFEGSSYNLFVPILDISFLKKQLDRLCRNMGGCTEPKEMKINYELTEFGVKISFSGGC